MKFNFTLLLLINLSLCSTYLYSQNMPLTVAGGEYKFNENRTQCLTDEQRAEVLFQIKSNLSLLRSQKRLIFDAQKRTTVTLFSWPVKMKDGAPYNEVWSISNYVDQNPEFPNKLLDYNCGSKTYDTNEGYNHMGVDIYTWPFTWKMMDNDEAEIIAAAPGQIIAIGRDKFDRSCTNNNNTWNAVYVQHADGSVALYGHMKKDSPTAKNVGDTVERGELLGIIGSSGNSTGPHLHFEVYSEIEVNGIGQDVLIDPYAGACNNLNTDTWWQDQKSYVNPNINAVLTHSEPPVFTTCPDQEITYEKNDFATGEKVYLAIYLRDQMAGTKINLKVLRPNGTVYNNWDFDLTENYSSSYWYWSINAPALHGEWTWRATYQDQIVDHKFTVGTLGIEQNKFDAISIYPNPFHDVVNILSNSLIKKATITDVLGKTISIIQQTDVPIEMLNLESLSEGMYFLTLEGNTRQKKTIKLLKK